MVSSLSNLVNNLSEGIHIIKSKYEHNDKKCETYRIKYKYCNCFLEYTKFKDDLMEYKCFYCKKNYQQGFDKKLKERFFTNTNFLTRITISLFYCWEKVFILMNIWIIGKNSMKQYYQIFTVIHVLFTKKKCIKKRGFILVIK